MNKDDKINAWLKDLRSGKYLQGKDSMYSSQSDSYCCLGVLSKTCADNEQIDFEELYDFNSTYTDIEDYYESALNAREVAEERCYQTTTVDPFVAKWLPFKNNVNKADLIVPKGLTRVVNENFHSSVNTFLATMNDNNVSFNKIAEIIEANKEVFFE